MKAYFIATNASVALLRNLNEAAVVFQQVLIFEQNQFCIPESKTCNTLKNTVFFTENDLNNAPERRYIAVEIFY